MPKSKRNRTVHMTQVSKKTREHKDKLLENIRDAIPDYQHIFVFSIENMRNTHLQELRKELNDSKIFLGKTTLMTRALGRTPEDSAAEGLHQLSRHVHGTAGLLLTNREPAGVLAQLAAVTAADFARAGATAPRGFTLPAGPVMSTGGEVPAAHDVPLGHTLEPELRRLGVPTRMVRGRVVLGEEDGAGPGYPVCREGDVLDSRQTRLLKLFSVCLSEFAVGVRAYWSAATGEVKVVDPDAGMDESAA